MRLSDKCLREHEGRARRTRRNRPRIRQKRNRGRRRALPCLHRQQVLTSESEHRPSEACTSARNVPPALAAAFTKTEPSGLLDFGLPTLLLAVYGRPKRHSLPLPRRRQLGYGERIRNCAVIARLD